MALASSLAYLPLHPARAALIEDGHGRVDVAVEDGAQVDLDATPMNNLVDSRKQTREGR